MTIKRRLFISNIIMALSPIAITAIIFLGVRFIVVDSTAQTRGGLGGRFADMPHIPAVSQSETAEAFARGNFTYVTSNISLYHSGMGDYIIILPDLHRHALEEFLTGPNFTIPIILLCLLVMIVLANVLLAKYITNRIMTPINTLAGGVQEIASGNLTHRINHSAGDEFDAVCSDFNHMAAHLSQMVQQRQADETSRRELIAGISHDLRTPLTAVKAYIEGLRKGIASTPEMREKYLDIIQSKTEDIEYIIKQLFTFSKIDIGEFPFNIEPVDIGRELANMVTGLTDEYQAMGLKVSLTENAYGVPVLIDRIQFKNILQNILGNSLKYSNRIDARASILCKKTNNGNVNIIIQDNGPGIPEEMLSKIFDVFYRANASRNNPAKGSGLGLAISSKIILRLNGAISAENPPEGGLRVIITLPVTGIGSKP
ncbi:MAG: ATP-binding protein [Defluviitaleaceae bacterium]|nr:ATP-binding protein [Defluviitaleaceae bacterium]